MFKQMLKISLSGSSSSSRKISKACEKYTISSVYDDDDDDERTLTWHKS